MASRYSYGADLEYRVRDHFEDAAYYVMRSAGSGGVADLVALDMLLPKARPVLIQCKRVKSDLSVAAWNHFHRIAEAAGAVALVAVERKDKALAYDLKRITGTRVPRTPTKAWADWKLDPDRDRPQNPIAVVPFRPPLCVCGHSATEHPDTWCSECLCPELRKDIAGVTTPRRTVDLPLDPVATMTPIDPVTNPS